mmetsp:Transcript_8159/g.28958  ORF Transcript_8159/g.28958 Transcript_8159/m.28958 type:complete len:99 (+) Transcript_8159:433-729(+)
MAWWSGCMCHDLLDVQCDPYIFPEWDQIMPSAVKQCPQTQIQCYPSWVFAGRRSALSIEVAEARLMKPRISKLGSIFRSHTMTKKDTKRKYRPTTVDT